MMNFFQLAKQLLAKIYRKTVFREKNFSKTLNIEDLYGSFYMMPGKFILTP